MATSITPRMRSGRYFPTTFECGVGGLALNMQQQPVMGGGMKKYFAVVLVCGSACLLSTPPNAQQSLIGKSCLGTFDTRKSTSGEYDLGAVRISFGSTMPLTATTEVAPGKAAFDRPEKVTKYDPSSQATDIVYTNKTWTFTSTSGSKWKLVGDGISLTGQVDPRPRQPNIAFIKLNCK
jgi:hypothetical protein